MGNCFTKSQNAHPTLGTTYGDRQNDPIATTGMNMQRNDILAQIVSSGMHPPNGAAIRDHQYRMINGAIPIHLVPAKEFPANYFNPSMMNYMPNVDSMPIIRPPQQQPSQQQIAEYRGFAGQVPAAISPNPTPELIRVRALYSYTARNSDDLNFQKGDILFVSSDMHEPWWLAVHSKTRQHGYIPSNYFVKDDGSLESHDAWYNISRREADKKLLLVGLEKGTFILRPSSALQNYALSIRSFDPKTNNFLVKHYKIRRTDNNSYFINEYKPFYSIDDLLNHYRTQADGLCCTLAQPCPRKYKPPAEFRKFEVPRECIRKVKDLGKGSFGAVFLATWNNSVEVAVKTHLAKTDVTKFIEEARTMHKLNHPRIVRLLGICTIPNTEPIFIILEHIARGALNSFLKSEEGRKLKLEDLLDMMAQICDGMSYLEQREILHRDLRAANVLVDEDNSVKVSDFGLAREQNAVSQHARFPIKWTAPEAALKEQFSVKSDVWSFGVLVYEMVTYGDAPYPTMQNRDVLQAVNQGYRMPNPNNPPLKLCPDDLYNLMKNCWHHDPENRPTFASLKDIFTNWSNNFEQQYLDER